MSTPDLTALRADFHREVCCKALSIRAERSVRGVPTPVYSNADKHSEISVDLGSRLAERLPRAEAPAMKGQQLGGAFERAVLSFLDPALNLFPAFTSKRMKVAPGRVISHFSQFAHLAEIQALMKENPELEATLGGDYLVNPDLVVSWDPLEDASLRPAVDPEQSKETLSPVRLASAGARLPLLHASVSCKWTIRSDRAQNIRTEALNLVRNRKGRTPHIVAVTMEPDPNRLAAIAIGTGDVDCVYHGALGELREAAAEAAGESPGRAGAARQLEMMVRSSRLRDIVDLPLDLLV